VGGLRVNRRLAMTRSIGDFDLKECGVIAEPEVKQMNLKHGKDRYLVLVTDGISFVMSDEEIGAVVSRCEKPHEAAEKLVDQALLHSSEDNVTALVVPFGAWGMSDPSDGHASVIYGIGRNLAGSARFS